MYIDVELDRYTNNFHVTIYRNDFAERITAKNMNIVVGHIRNILMTKETTLYIDNKGFGKCLTDCLDKIGVSYEVLKNVSLNLNNHMIMINGNWEQIKDLSDVLRIVSENIGSEFTQKVEEIFEEELYDHKS